MDSNLLEVSVSDKTPRELVVRLKGEIDQLTVRNLRSALDKYEATEAAQIVFDLEDVDFMASAGLAIFAYYFELFKKRGLGQKLKVINCSEGVFRVFHLTMLDEMIDVTCREN
jgi:anti-anti-sigma factor